MKSLKVIISGGGTGGHIFPAVAIAQEIKSRYPSADILFIGAIGKMEMEKVPQAGFNIVGLPIAGMQRGSIVQNLSLPYKVIKSIWKVRKIIANFQPTFVVGTGGYASAPSLWMAQNMGVPTFVQEQNALPGKTNRFIGKNAKAVFTAFPEMEQFFGNTPTYFFGNPIRQNISNSIISQAEAKAKLGLDGHQLCILSVGGSLGSRNINNAWKANTDLLKNNTVQLLWQTGKTDYSELQKTKWDTEKIKMHEFITEMSLAYVAADIVVSRAGAISISELSVVAKPVVLVPYPFAAEDHQTMNAQSLVNKNAAVLIKDSQLEQNFATLLESLLKNKELREELKTNITFFAKPNAAKDIVTQMLTSIKA